ncbi:MAG: glycosyltransferase family 2 protein [Bacteroidetes bacterium]|nr:glycosyltransferase family 2 protein [Bacteroidota bacterium]
MKPFALQSDLDLSIVIVSYNVRDFLKDCLESIYQKITDITFEVFVVDNHSSDNTKKMVKQDFPQVILIENKENMGFARANNIAFHQSRGRYILMLNPDTKILGGNFQGFLNNFKHKLDVGAIGCKMLNTDETLQPSCYNFSSLREIFGLYFLGSRWFSGLKKMDYDICQDVDFARGAFLALNRKCLEQIGFLDEEFFMFGEETDLCYRMKKTDWRTLYDPNIVIIHHKGKSAEKVPSHMMLQRVKSLIYFFSKHYGPFRVFFLRFIITIGVGLRFILRPFLEKRQKRLGKKMTSVKEQKDILKLVVGIKL